MSYVYLLQSTAHPNQHYVGCTERLGARMVKHNAGEVLHTSKFRPWTLQWYCWFPTKERAFEFERYLKSGSG
jgi:predicted GIY-YIG superfamily endonuclease